jgi:16S rRNA (uracil1498-N3)-methyltransferase
VITRRTQATRLNAERMHGNAVEAAEQCGILSLPAIDDIRPLDAALAGWPAERTLIFCDEEAEPGGPLPALRELGGKPLAVLIGPEGGFDPGERKAILALPAAVRISLGPRILRADTAAVAALALVQAAAGDWR